MEITKVKQYGEGYLVNDTLSVPNAPGNRHYQAIQTWLQVEGNNLTPEFTPEELAAKALADERDAKLALAEKMLSAGKAIIKEFHILNQGDEINPEMAAKNAEVFAGLKIYLDAGSEYARSILETVDLTGTSITEVDRSHLLLVWDTAIA